MNTPRNTVGTPITGQERDDLPDQQPGAVPQEGQEVKRPSEVDRPRARDADHLRAAAPRRAEGGVSDPDMPRRP